MRLPVTCMLFLSIALLGVAQHFSAHAEDGGTSVTKLMGKSSADLSPEAVFELMDGNGDAKVDAEELRVHKMDVFFVRDGDRDTRLSRQELDVISDALYGALDKDGDGQVSGFEFNQSDLTKFESIDADSSGAITLEEFEAYRLEIQ